MAVQQLQGQLQSQDNYSDNYSHVMNPGCNHLYQKIIQSNTHLPFELWFLVFEYLDIVDLMSCSEVCTQFRLLAFSKQLMHHRLANTSDWLERQFPNRPSLKDLYERHILLSSSPFANSSHIKLAIKLQRVLRRETLKRKLECRPTHKELVEHGVIKPGGVLACRMRTLERQQIVDAMHAFFSSSQRPTVEKAIQRGLLSPMSLRDEEHKPVRFLTRMFSVGTSSKSSLNLKNNGLNRSEPPTRAKVCKLKHKFEVMEKKLQDPEYKDVYERKQLDKEMMAMRPLKRQLTGITSGAVASLRQRFVSVSA